MSITVGSSSWKICISTSVSGSGVSAAPDGSKLYLKSASVDLMWRMGMKIYRWNSRKSRAYKNGKVSQDVKVSDALILGAVGDLSTDNNINDLTFTFIDDAHKKGGNPLYFWLYLPNPDGADPVTNTKKTFMDNTEARIYYLRGYLSNPNIKIRRGRVYKMDFVFTECWT